MARPKGRAVVRRRRLRATVAVGEVHGVREAAGQHVMTSCGRYAKALVVDATSRITCHACIGSHTLNITTKTPVRECGMVGIRVVKDERRKRHRRASY